MIFHNTSNDINIGNIINFCSIKNNDELDKSIYLNNFLRSNIADVNDLTFYNNLNYPIETKSNYILTNEKLSKKFKNKCLLISDNLDCDIAIISNFFYSSKNLKNIDQLEFPLIDKNSNISKNSFINKGVVIGKDFNLSDFSSIDYNCIIGNNVNIGKNVSISNTIIGDNVDIGDGCKIGQAGFGFSYDSNNTPIKIFHIERVILQNGVNLKSNCTVDRGSFDDTIIGENTYIDNQVHVAHNVKIGMNCIIAGQSGIAGSSIIGKNVHIGGQVGIAGHLDIGNNVKIAAKSGVIRNINEGEIVMGYPSTSINRYLKNYKKLMM